MAFVAQDRAGIVPAEPEESVRRVVVVGLGRAGLPSAVCLARAGYEVVGADVGKRVVDALRAGRSPLRDAVRDDEVRGLVASGRLRATGDTTAAVRDAEFILVCVPTPLDERRKPDLGPLERASFAVGRGLRRGAVVSYESATFPGCTERACIPILERESGLAAGSGFGVAHCPGRLNPGDDDHTTEATPRVLGAIDARSLRVARSVYSRILATPLHLCPDIRTAEAAKALENVQRDVNIALVNEFAGLARSLGLDAHAVLAAARTKFNFHPMEPGPGVGGHCIPVDPCHLIEEARRAGFEPRLMATAREVNDGATDAVARAILENTPARAHAKVALLGLAYKGGVGDLRGSPSLRLLDLLRGQVRALAVHDPRAEPEAILRAARLPPLDLAEAVRGAHAVALLTDHPEFRGIDWGELASLAAPGALVVDGRNLVEPGRVRAQGLRYWGIGRGAR
jgi:UDP-N-acetyl-D-galactosamine dehydrogenase